MGKRASARNVELLRRFYESFNQHDIDAVLELCTEEVEVYKSPDVVEMVAAFTPRGRDLVAQYLSGWLESWSEYNARPEEFIQAGDDVAVMVQVRARGRGSQFEIAGRMADVFKLENGLIAQLRLYVQEGDAMASLGLR
jgi:ketosteroid isomerase-like protein